MKLRWNTILSVALFTSTLAFSDYAWIPKYDNLWVKLGFDYLASKENVGSDGQRNDITYQNRLVNLTEYKFWFETEYGIARDVSAYLRPTFLWNSINPETGTGTGFPTGSGLSDVFLGFKYSAIKTPLFFTPEIITKLPLYSTSVSATDQLVVGDGDFSIGLIANTGYKAGKYVALGFSPGLLYRSNNYKSQALLNGMVAFIYNPVFLRLFWDWRLSLGKEDLGTAVVLNNPATGTGSSFARLSTQQDLLSVGVKFGIKFHKNYRIDLNFQQAVSGNLAPHYWQLGFNLFAPFDFYHEEKKIKLKEVPFESDQSTEVD